MNWEALLKALLPIVLPEVVPGGALIAPIALHAITAAESAPGKTGDQKLGIAMAIVQDGVAVTNTAAGHVVIDPASINNGVASGISAVVDSVKAVQLLAASRVKPLAPTPSETAAPPLAPQPVTPPAPVAPPSS